MVRNLWRIEGFRGDRAIISYGVNNYGDGPEGYIGEFPISEAKKMVENNNRNLNKVDSENGRS